MKYIYYELNTSGPSPMYSRILSLGCVLVNDGNISVHTWNTPNLSDEFTAVKEFSELISGYDYIAFASANADKYLGECLRQYSLANPLKKLTLLPDDSDELSKLTDIVSIPVYEGELKHYFSDYKNYYYLPIEDTAIHKSVAEFVDKSAKEKATPDTAYIKKTGTFVPAGITEKNIFRKSLKDPESYILYEDMDASAVLHFMLLHPDSYSG